MKIGTFGIGAGLLAVGLATLTLTGWAQGPMWDVVHVNLPYSVSIGDKTLAPGDYTIQQNRDEGGGSRVLLIYSDQGMKFETSAMTIPALDQNTARHTEVILHHIGPEYYFDKIWIQGKDYGYEFPLPPNVKSREKEMMAAVTVPAEYSTMASQTTTATTTQQNPPAVAENRPVETPQATQPAQPAQPTQPMTTTPSEPSANRAVEEPAPSAPPASMPATSAGWLMMLLAGGSLSSAGMVLRRKRR